MMRNLQRDTAEGVNPQALKKKENGPEYVCGSPHRQTSPFQNKKAYAFFML
jgi:hypothetical protein